MLRYVRQLASESLVYGLSSTLTKMVHFILVPIYTRVFTPEEYGTVSLVVIVMAAAQMFVTLALDSSAHRWFWDSEEVGHRKATVASWAWCQLGTSTVAALMLSAAANPIAEWLVEDADAALYVRLVAWSLPLTTLGTVTTNWLRMQRRPWMTLLFNLATVLSTTLLTIVLVVWLRWGIAGVFWAQLATAGLVALLAIIVLRDWVHPRHFDWSRLASMLRFALPLIPAALSFWVVNAIDRLFVQQYSSTAEVGVYQVGFVFASVVALATQAFQQAWGPFSYSIHQQPDAREFYAKVLPTYLWITCLLSSAAGVFAPELIRIFATSAYQGAAGVTALLAFGYVMVGLGYIAGLGSSLSRQTMPIGVAITAAATLNILLNFVLTPRMGKEGAALATLLSQSVVPAYVFWRSQKLYPIPYRFVPAAGIVAFAAGITWIGTRVQMENFWFAIIVKLLLLSLFVPLVPTVGIVSVARISQLIRRTPVTVGGK